MLSGKSSSKFANINVSLLQTGNKQTGSNPVQT